SEKKVNIPPKEYAVLVILLEAAGEIVSKNTLLDQVWGDAEVNATAKKVACGAAESVPLIRVTNLARTMRMLQEENIWIVGTAG
ncbi:winged helix-turn-helix domain-containing protein, partial [Salmonella enterica subsp. enterica serovar Montevideo]|nr:winged helix-turn-helix domain-containing protein [Salmonella enterica subsp. enterica serovar Montevideo]